MIRDNQGRGSPENEGFPEFHKTRVLENYVYEDKSSNKPKSSSLTKIVTTETNIAIEQILTNGDKKIMDTNLDAQSLQKQIDCCRDFCVAIDVWTKMNQKAVQDLQTAIDEAIACNSLADFQPRMSVHWKVFEEFTQGAIGLLNKSKEGFQAQAKAAILAKNKLGESARLHNHVNGGLTDNLMKKI